MSKFTINVLDPSSPIDHDTPVPDTGLYTNASNINSSVNVMVPIIVLVVVFILLAPVFLKLIIKHNKKNNDHGDNNTVNTKIDIPTNTDSISLNNKANLKRALLIITPVITLAVITPAIAFTILNNINPTINNNNSNKDNIDVSNMDTTELTTLERLTSDRNLSITVSANDVNLNVTLDSDNNGGSNNNDVKTGVYAVVENTVTINPPTVSGYKLYASAEDTDLYLNGDKYDTTHKISAVSDSMEYDKLLSPNTWGISSNPSVADDPTLRSWFVFPSEPTEVYKTSSATEADHQAGTLYFGTYITPNLVNKYTKEGYGTYSGVTINYIAIANPIDYNINYLKNTSDDVTDMPSNVSDATYDEAIAISSNVPQRTNHIFKGWCGGVVNTDTATHTDTCDGAIYNPDGSDTNLTYTIDQTISPNNLTLYAMWQETPYTYSVIYNKNTEEAVTNMPDGISETTTYDSIITLSSTEPNRDNYEFIGWCTTEVTDGGSCDNPNTKYLPGASYNLDSSATNEIKLYAMWGTSAFLYNKVASLVKKDANGIPRVQTPEDLKKVIIKPTSSDPATDTSNSGVYLYNEEIFGTAADSNKIDGTRAIIYYYRGILDSNLDGTSSAYGSIGDGVYYPNYVRLGDTCWRIVRTTASGGVKMVYNGSYSGGTTADSCANALDDAQLSATSAFGLKGGSSQTNVNWVNNINRIGYTFNNDPNIQDSTNLTSVDTVFGSNSNYSTTNTTDSAIKETIETWFNSTSDIDAYESMLEPNAGYCNDRKAFSDIEGDTELSSILPYATSDTNINFGSFTRNFVTNSSKTLTLSCPRGIVDLYTFKTDNDTNLNDGNGQLRKPVALITADEAALAGSGKGGLNIGRTIDSTYSSNYSFSSYLRSGKAFWLLSPYDRYSNGNALESVLYSGGGLSNYYVGIIIGVRPAISLKHETIIASGSGTAVDPWVILPDNNQAPEATNPLGVMEENNNSWKILKIVLIILSIVSILFYILVLIQKIKNYDEKTKE